MLLFLLKACCAFFQVAASLGIESRVQQIRARLGGFKSKARARMEAPPLIITLVAGINPNAPPGTEIDGETTSFVWPPANYRGPLPEGIPTFDEWSRSEALKEKQKCPTESH